jgi:hypothetical protein
MYYELSWLSYGSKPRNLAGPVPPTFDVQIGDRFAVWAELDGSYDVYAYDFAMFAQVPVANNPAIQERQPATSGPWIVWEQQDGASSTIEALNMDTGQRVTIDSGGSDYSPSIDGDLITWESDVAGNLEIWVHRISTGESFPVTDDPVDQYLNDVFADLVAYVDQSSGSDDIWVSTLEFGPPRVITPASDTGRYSAVGFHDPEDSDYTATVGGERSFFVFDLTSLTDPRPIVAATLILDVGAVSQGTFGGISYTLYDVSTPIPTLVAGGEGLTAIYDDLGSGVPFSAETEIAPAAAGTEISIPLLPAGLAAVRAANGGAIAIGGGPTGLGGNFAFGGTDVSGARLKIEFAEVPVPSLSPAVLALLATLVSGFGAVKLGLCRRASRIS